MLHENYAEKDCFATVDRLRPIAIQVQNALGIKTPTPVVELQNVGWKRRNIRVLMKRDDLTHPFVQGNKWRKLKYNLATCIELGSSRIVTAGGAYSNHLLSVAAAGKVLGIPTVAFVRGENPDSPSAVLSQASGLGMELHFVDRPRFNKIFYGRTEDLPDLITNTDYFIPPGGSNLLGLYGTSELVEEFPSGIDIVCCGCGTGGTLAGIASRLPPDQHVIGFAALKGKGYLEQEIDALLANRREDIAGRWSIDHDYHFGGFAKTNQTLQTFAREFFDKNGILLDPVYTSKMMHGLDQRIQSGDFKPGTTILALHSGGIVH